MLKSVKKSKKLRKRDDITQEKLAEFLGVTSQAISKWESGNGYPDIEYITPTATFFNVTTDYLLEHDMRRKDMEINIFFGLAVLPVIEDNVIEKKFLSNIKNLRQELKDGFNIDMPLINVMDNLDFSPHEIAIETDGNTVWKQDFEGSKNFDAIGDAVIASLKQIQLQSREVQ